MLGDDAGDWCDGVLRRERGDEVVKLLLVNHRPPHAIRLPICDTEMEAFELDSWEDARPIYRSVGLLPRS